MPKVFPNINLRKKSGMEVVVYKIISFHFTSYDKWVFIE